MMTHDTADSPPPLAAGLRICRVQQEPVCLAKNQVKVPRYRAGNVTNGTAGAARLGLRRFARASTSSKAAVFL